MATALLERAFRDTYGLEMGDVFGDEERAIATYRYAVSQLIPALTEAAWRDKRDEILANTPAADRSSVVFLYRPVDYEETYGRNYQKPARLARFLAWVYRIVPKVGPLKPLAFKAPTPEVDRLFEDSIERAHSRFQAMLRQVRDGTLDLSNTNFDTGEPVHVHDYELADETHAEWLEALARHDFAGASPDGPPHARRLLPERPSARPARPQGAQGMGAGARGARAPRSGGAAGSGAAAGLTASRRLDSTRKLLDDARARGVGAGPQGGAPSPRYPVFHSGSVSST